MGESGVIATGGSWSPGGTLGDIVNGIFSNGIFAIDLFDVVFFTLFALGLMLLPYRRPMIFRALSFKPGGKLGVTAIGLAGVTANIVLPKGLYATCETTGLNHGFSPVHFIMPVNLDLKSTPQYHPRSKEGQVESTPS